MSRVWVDELALKEIERGVLHIYKQHVEKVDASDGDWVEILYKNKPLAYGFYSERSSIPVKIFSWEEESPEEIIFRRMERLWKRKKEESFRWVFAEGDILPGLIVDVYNDVAVFKTNIVGLDRMKENLVEFLSQYYDNIVERNDSSSRKLEGLPPIKRVVRGRPVTQIREGDRIFIVDSMEGQKTGFYLDQKENRIYAERFTGEKVLDVFSYTGAFGIHVGGYVTFIEQGRWESKMIEQHMKMNGVEGKVIRGNAVDVMKKLPKSSYDVIILDPPALAKEKKDISKARRMYHLLHLLALRLLTDGGILLTSSCSHYITPKEFLGIIHGAARSKGVKLRMLGSLRGQAADHTVYLPQPETQYLKHGVFEVWKS